MKKEICDKNMKFEDCELAILRTAVDKAEERQGSKSANSPEIKKIITPEYINKSFIRAAKIDSDPEKIILSEEFLNV